MTRQILYLVIRSAHQINKNMISDKIPKHNADNCAAKEAVNALFYNFFK